MFKIWLCLKKYRYTREQFVTKSRFKGVLLDLFNYLEYETSYTCGQFCIRFPCELFFLMKKMDSHSNISLEGGTKDCFFWGEKKLAQMAHFLWFVQIWHWQSQETYMCSTDLSLVLMRQLRLETFNQSCHLNYLIIYESDKHLLSTHCVQATGLDTRSSDWKKDLVSALKKPQVW